MYGEEKNSDCGEGRHAEKDQHFQQNKVGLTQCRTTKKRIVQNKFFLYKLKHCKIVVCANSKEVNVWMYDVYGPIPLHGKFGLCLQSKMYKHDVINSV